jgi:hypothetical protein
VGCYGTRVANIATDVAVQGAANFWPKLHLVEAFLQTINSYEQKGDFWINPVAKRLKV